MKKNTIVSYSSDSVDIGLIFDENQQIWATAQNIADIFGTDISNIRKHIQNIYQDNEADENSTSAKIARVQIEGGIRKTRTILHYNVDIILSVGHRVSSKKAILFRQWSTHILRQYLEKGYVLNQSKLADEPEALKSLAAEVRALRSSEKSTYAILRDCFKICASDYDEDSNKAKSFFALLQDKFYHAITKMTASKIIEDRVSARDINMGLENFKGDIPTKEEALIAKNYLGSRELYELHLLSEAFLILAESMIARSVKMTMESLHDKIDETLRLHEYDVFGGYKDYKNVRERVNFKAKQEHDRYIDILKLQMLDLDTPFNLDDFYDGEYEYLREEINQITLPQVKKMFPEIQEKLLLLR